MNINHIHQRNSLRPEERLKHEKQIKMLFQQGEAFSFYPLRVVYRFVPSSSLHGAAFAPARLGISIPKKKFRHAHYRNRIRRLLKEAWRTQKHQLYQAMAEGWQLHCFLIYSSKEIPTFEKAKATVGAVLNQLTRKAEARKGSAQDTL